MPNHWRTQTLWLLLLHTSHALPIPGCREGGQVHAMGRGTHGQEHNVGSLGPGYTKVFKSFKEPPLFQAGQGNYAPGASQICLPALPDFTVSLRLLIAQILAGSGLYCIWDHICTWEH